MLLFSLKVYSQYCNKPRIQVSKVDECMKDQCALKRKRKKRQDYQQNVTVNKLLFNKNFKSFTQDVCGLYVLMKKTFFFLNILSNHVLTVKKYQYLFKKKKKIKQMSRRKTSGYFS